jgi:ABC-type multidrug transport system fused ATPase/permease subunit
MARAAYSKAPVVLLDDALSALDPAVATHTFDACILKMMAGRTRVLVTHSAVVADCADQVLSLSDARELTVTAMTTKVAAVYASAAARGGGGDRLPASAIIRASALSLAASGLGAAAATGATVISPPPTLLPSKKLPPGLAAAREKTESAAAASADQGSLFSFFHDFNAGIGGGFWIPLFNIILLGCEVGSVETGVFFVAVYADRAANGEDPDNTFYLGLYTLSIVLEVLFAYMRAALQHYGAQRTHRRLQSQLVGSIMDAGIAYFDNTPAGEVLSILTGDLNACDGVTVQVTSFLFNILPSPSFLQHPFCNLLSSTSLIRNQHPCFNI